MKKIALMTWHHAENYGTAYQAYALKTLIEQQGYKVDLIDYHRLNSAPMNVPDISAVISSKFISLGKKLLALSIQINLLIPKSAITIRILQNLIICMMDLCVVVTRFGDQIGMMGVSF